MYSPTLQLLFSVAPTFIGTQDIMLDDITLMSCTEEDIPPGSDQLSCDFEENTCGWYIDQSASLIWERTKGQKPSYDNQGPGHDQTTGSGESATFILAQYLLHQINLLMCFYLLAIKTMHFLFKVIICLWQQKQTQIHYRQQD